MQFVLMPQKLQKEALGNSYYAGGGKTGFLRRLAWDKPAPTLVTDPSMPATDLAHPELNRPLSIEEYKRVQEFPDDWKLAGNLRYQYKQIGNAVPPLVAKTFGKIFKVKDPSSFVAIPIFCFGIKRFTLEIPLLVVKSTTFPVTKLFSDPKVIDILNNPATNNKYILSIDCILIG